MKNSQQECVARPLLEQCVFNTPKLSIPTLNIATDSSYSFPAVFPIHRPHQNLTILHRLIRSESRNL